MVSRRKRQRARRRLAKLNAQLNPTVENRKGERGDSPGFRPQSRNDWLLVKKAVMNNWDIPPDTRQQLAEYAAETARDADRPLLALAAAETLICMEQQNNEIGT